MKTTILGDKVALEAINLYKQGCAEKGTNVVYCGNQKLSMPYVSDGDAWCVGFVQYCYKRALENLVLPSEMPKTASVLYLYEAFKKLSYPINNVPVVGSIGFRRTNITTSKKLKDGSPVSHAFIVVEVSDNKIITVEGNTSDKIDFRYYPNGTYAISDHLFIHAEMMGGTKIIDSKISFQLLPEKTETSPANDYKVEVKKNFRKRYFG